MSFKQATYDEPHIKSMQSRTTFETITGEFSNSIIPQSMQIDQPSVPMIPEYDVVRYDTAATVIRAWFVHMLLVAFALLICCSPDCVC